jgi:hypothetical protein
MSTEEQRHKRAEQRRETRRMIEVGKIKVLATLMAALPNMVARLSDDEWRRLRDNEDRRREQAKP